MSFLPTKTGLFARFRTGIFSEAGRGGPGRLMAIVGVAAVMALLLVVISMINHKAAVESKVAKMKTMTLLPGGTHSTPAQEALLARHSQAEARKAEAEQKSYTPPMPGSVPLVTSPVKEIGADAPLPAPVQVASLEEVHTVAPNPPAYVAPETPQPGLIEKVSDPAPQDAAQAERMAPNDIFNAYEVRAPRTDIVLTPAADKAMEAAGSRDLETTGRTVAAPAVASQTPVLVPAGRGVYAHTVVSVNSDTGGPIILEADTGPLAGDRMLGSFTKSAGDRLVVRVTTVEHRGKSIDVGGLVVAPDSMETSVASAIDEHYAERFILPAAAAFVEGVGQAMQMANATTTVSPFGGSTTQYGQLNFKQQLGVGAGAAAQSIGTTLQQSVPKGPTIILGSNVGVGVMFLSDVHAPN